MTSDDPRPWTKCLLSIWIVIKETTLKVIKKTNLKVIKKIKPKSIKVMKLRALNNYMMMMIEDLKALPRTQDPRMNKLLILSLS